jgi:hypothetical protein
MPPQPTPPPPVTASSFPLTASNTFQTITARRIYTAAAGSISSDNGVTGRSSTISITYNSDGTYTVSDALASISASFIPSDRTSSSGFLDVYSKQGTGVTDDLTLFNNVRSGAAQASAPIQLTYLSYGIWSHANSQTGEKRKNYMLFGYPTGQARPVSGSATYQTAVTGNMVEGGPAFPATESDLAGSATFTASFGTGAISTDLTLQRLSGQSIGTFNGTGNIASGSDQFTGSFTSTNQTFAGGSFIGGFFGPSAQEMGYAFQVNLHNPDPFAGASPAPMDTVINGAVVGRKQ